MKISGDGLLNNQSLSTVHLNKQQIFLGSLIIVTVFPLSKHMRTPLFSEQG